MTRCFLMVATVLFLACGGGGGDPGESDASVGGGRFSGTVSFDGTGEGLLTVGLFRATPPNGPPLWSFIARDPSFPVEYEIDGVSPGVYYLGATFDIGSNNPTIPGSEDATAFPPEAHTVEAGSSFELDLTLTPGS